MWQIDFAFWCWFAQLDTPYEVYADPENPRHYAIISFCKSTSTWKPRELEMARQWHAQGTCDPLFVFQDFFLAFRM